MHGGLVLCYIFGYKNNKFPRGMDIKKKNQYQFFNCTT